MDAERPCPDQGDTDDTAEVKNDADSSVGPVGVWMLFGTITLGIALFLVYLSTISAKYVFLSGWMTTFGYREFAIVNGLSATISYATAYRLYML